jgi:hypothetical protein
MSRRHGCTLFVREERRGAILEAGGKQTPTGSGFGLGLSARCRARPGTLRLGTRLRHGLQSSAVAIAARVGILKRPVDASPSPGEHGRARILAHEVGAEAPGRLLFAVADSVNEACAP